MSEHLDYSSLAAPSAAALYEAQRRRRGVQAALVELEQAIAAPSTGRERAWLDRVGDQLAVLQTAFGHHVAATEEPAGLFDEVISQAPRLIHQVDYLRTDHVRLTKAIDAALAGVRAVNAEGRISDLTEIGLDLLARLTRHRHLGSTLVYEAYTVDIDAAD